MDVEQFRLNYDVELRHWWFVARRRILYELIDRLLPASTDTTIVDIGCGLHVVICREIDAFIDKSVVL